MFLKLTHLNLFLVTTAIALFPHRSFSSDKSGLPIKVEARLSNDYYVKFQPMTPWNEDYWAPRYLRYNVEIVVTNTSSKTIFLWFFSCDWERSFIMNKKQVQWVPHDCDKNNCGHWAVPPYGNKIFHGTVIETINADYPGYYFGKKYEKQYEKTQMGLVVIDDIYKPKLDLIEGGRKMGDTRYGQIIWSNPIYLPK